MNKAFIVTLMFAVMWNSNISGQIDRDAIETSAGVLEIYFVGHGTLMFTHNGLVIHVDPVMSEADYDTMPDADLILVTHQHGDHLDKKAIGKLWKNGTRLVMTQACRNQMDDMEATVMKNGDSHNFYGIGVEAVPAYNIQHLRPNGTPFHPRGEGNGYILTFGDTKVLVAGDTENIPELKELKGTIRVAFFPMNLPYTMDPGMVADLAVAIRPSILYPYHYGNTDTRQLVNLLNEEEDIEVRIRDLQ